jgi:L-ascorbate metabolism protein UlaG (beta-lactamase superfamily)
MTRQVVDPARLGFVDIITSSHGHTDHLDGVTLRAILNAGWTRTLVVPEAVAQLAYERISTATCMPRIVTANDPMSIVDARGFLSRITPIQAVHEGAERDAEGRCRCLGYIFRFSGGWTVYHSGDTIVYEGLSDRLRQQGPIDVAILPINGKVGNMNGTDAARLAKAIGAKLVIPCHYEMFEFNTADPRDAFIPECERLGQPYKVLRAGERWSSSD